MLDVIIQIYGIIKMKISVIMQVYLGEYPGSRSDSDKKFLRAVQSFIDQSNTNSELILVSDGCMITHDLYYKHFKENDRIKYAYVDKDTPNMYEGEVKYYRGIPRQVGRSIATGEIITYMDSDDFLLQRALEFLELEWQKYNDLDVIGLYNASWIDNAIILNHMEDGDLTMCIGKPLTLRSLESTWIHRCMLNNMHIVSATWAMSHKASFAGIWEDSSGDLSEDMKFSMKLQQTKKVSIINIPYYVRCHYSNLWDY